jgi:hypothetical protein
MVLEEPASAGFFMRLKNTVCVNKGSRSQSFIAGRVLLPHAR